MIRNNQALMAEIDRICEVAGYLWEKGWAERNGGNISVNITELLPKQKRIYQLWLRQPNCRK